MSALLSYGFLQRALVAGLFIGAACALLGVFLVLKKDAMMGHGLAHITFAAVALALVLNILPLAVALVVAVAAAVGLSWLKDRAGLHGDTAIGIFSSAGLALGVFLATLSNTFNVSLLHYLFGEILAIEPVEVWLAAGLALLVGLAVLSRYWPLMYLTFDPESARASGIRTRRLDLLLTVLAAVTVVLGTKVVGILLVSALMVIPAASGLQMARSFKQALGLSVAVALVSVTAGILGAFLFDWPASATIVLVAFLLFGLSLAWKRSRRA
ncbi:MAG TPA: metal ABC transporter permease [Acidobacteriota bacterium]